VASDHATDGPSQKSHRKRGEGEQRTDGGIIANGEEQLTEYQGGCTCVEKKVVALKRGADKACCGYSFDGPISRLLFAVRK
jgi:hypothetical protein